MLDLERLLAHAACHEPLRKHSDEQAAWADDLLQAAAELAALRARVAEARALLDRATQFLGAEKGGTEYRLLSDIEDWLYPSAKTGLPGNKSPQRFSTEGDDRR